MESQVSVAEEKDGEKPESESAPVHRFVRQTSESPDTVAVQDMPTEPGLYWASCRIKGRYDSLLYVFGEQPFLKMKIIKLPVFIDVGTPMYVGTFGGVRAVGPKVVIPVLDDR